MERCALAGVGNPDRIDKPDHIHIFVHVKSPAAPVVALLLLSALLCHAGPVNPVKLAALARVDLNAAPVVGALNEGALTTGIGSVQRQSWLAPAEQPLTYTIQMPIVRFAWNEFALRFVPEKSGAIQISLRGPWEEVTAGSGIIYQQEVLWDALQATGTPLSNGGFETVTGGVISGWTGGVSQSATTLTPAVEGWGSGARGTSLTGL